MYIVNYKLFSVDFDFVDYSFKKLNLRPSPLKGISFSTHDSNLHQHGKHTIIQCVKYLFIYLAMQMWTLARFLLLAIGHLIQEDDEHWKNYLCLLDIMDILFARPVTADACAFAEVLLCDHHSKLKELYPNVSITLKLHSMIHMPRLMLEYVLLYFKYREKVYS